MANNRHQTRRKRAESTRREEIRIDVLPDDVLLEIFDFCVDMTRSFEHKAVVEAWQLLVHVCRRWRNVVFGSPRRLNLRLFCTPETPVKDTLDVWPPLPLLIRAELCLPSCVDNIIVSLKQSHRVSRVNLSGLGDRLLENVLAAMHVPFPELKLLQLSSSEELPVIPDSFLGGSATHLRTLEMDGIPFPGLPKLLLSAPHLRYLDLSNIPHFGYISPEAMAALLSVLPSLRTLALDFQFQSPQSRPNWESRRPLPPKRYVISALKRFDFTGVIEYLDDLVTYIDAPQLDHLFISFIYQIDVDSPRLAQFISRTPILRNCDAHASVELYDNFVTVGFPCPFRDSMIEISWNEPVSQLSSIARVCNSCLPPLYMIEHLYVGQFPTLTWTNDAIENTLWLELLRPFLAVKNLYLSKDFAPRIAAALQEIVGTEVLPSLQSIFVEGLEPSGRFQEDIGQFIAARELSGHPITISYWNGLGPHM